MGMSTDADIDRAELLAGELMSVTAAIRRTVRRQVARAVGGSLPTAQLELLMVIEREPGIGVARAAGVLQLAGNSVSALVQQVVSAGLVRRVVDPADRRAVCLFLTPSAAQRITKWRSVRNAIVAAALEHTSTDERAAIEQAVPALHRLLAQLRSDGAPA